ncbi:MAG: NAD-dependent dehydratase, partial [Spirochaetota bacterium]
QAELISLVEKELGKPVKTQVAGAFLLGFFGLFNPGAKEMVEMLYEFTAPFIMDGSGMERTFGLAATPMETRIRETLDWARSH